MSSTRPALPPLPYAQTRLPIVSQFGVVLGADFVSCYDKLHPGFGSKEFYWFCLAVPPVRPYLRWVQIVYQAVSKIQLNGLLTYEIHLGGVTYMTVLKIAALLELSTQNGLPNVRPPGSRGLDLTPAL